MSLKPEVVRVRGVHSVTNSSQGGDIGFPQLQLEKLFEAATVKELESGAEYTEGKKYAYLNPNWPADPNKYLSIESEAHFYCVRDGYCGLDGSADHYYTKEGDDYKYNAVPPTGSWEAKLEFSDAIKDKELYSISQEEERVYIEGQGYYKKDENGDYKKPQSASYYVYIKTGSINWSEENKYVCTLETDEETLDDITVWKNRDDALADPGCYISVFKLNASTYLVQLLDYIDFNDEGIWESNPNFFAAALYKLAEDDYGNDGIFTIDSPIYLYMKNDDKLSCFNEGEITFTYDPADPNADNSLYYIGDAPFVYPNYEYPYSAESIALLADKNSGVWRSFNQADFPLFTGAALSGISKVPNDPHTVYEKLAVTVNYKYSGNNNLKFIFTDKSVGGVLEACNLSSTLPSKYVHLTNLEYATDMA